MLLTTRMNPHLIAALSANPGAGAVFRAGVKPPASGRRKR